MWNRTIKLVLAAAIFSSSFAYGEVDSVIAPIPNDAGKSNAKIVISVIPAEDQREYLANLTEQLDSNSAAAALVATTGPRDPLARTPEYKELMKQGQTQSVVAESLNDLPVTPKSRKYRDIVKDYIKNRPPLGLKEKKAAVAVSVVPAIGYGTLVYLMSSDYLMATASFGLVLSVNTFQAVFSKKWSSFIDLGEKGASVVLNSLAKLTGKKPSVKTRAIAAASGKIGISIAFNTAIAAVNMAMVSELNSTWALLAFGFASIYDLWDQVLAKKIQNSPFMKKYFINSRVAIGSILECFALAGFGSAGMFLVGAAASSAAGMLFQAARTENEAPPELTWKQRVSIRLHRWSGRFTRWMNSVEQSYDNSGCSVHLIAGGSI